MTSDAESLPVSPRLAFDPPTKRARFNFADVFRAEDPVGHFVIALGAAMNDLLLINSLLFPSHDPNGDFTQSERISLSRMLLATVWEVHLLVANDTEWPEVVEFLDRVADRYPTDREYSGQELVASLRGESGATAPALRNVLRVARNSTFHYPKAGDEALIKVLSELAIAETDGEITCGDKLPSLRAAFAEQVMLDLALEELDGPQDEQYVGPTQ
jgi:hypothetical protein